jgi:hypothetical protein
MEYKNFDDVKVSMVTNPGSGVIEIRIFARKGRETWEATKLENMGMVFELVDDPMVYRVPLLRMDHFIGTDFLQKLSQGLIEAGFRDKVTSKDGEINRMEAHLGDMRKLLFHQEGIE